MGMLNLLAPLGRREEGREWLLHPRRQSGTNTDTLRGAVTLSHGPQNSQGDPKGMGQRCPNYAFPPFQSLAVLNLMSPAMI
jgi:hypothetical protein